MNSLQKCGVSVLMLASLTGCANLDGQNRYSVSDVGHSTAMEFGTVIAVREVEVTGENSGTGKVLGAGVGALAGSNDPVTMIAGAIIGGVAGHFAEQAVADNTGIEYTITKSDGKTMSIVQNQKKEDTVFAVGKRVMIQTSGHYQRVLSADHLPAEVKRAKTVKMVD